MRPLTGDDWRSELQDLAVRIGRRVNLMEVCGTHTVALFRTGLRDLLPANVRMISGPGCPVCVTAQRHIDAAIRLAGLPGVILATYGDMLRVPGRLGSLESQRASGATVRVVQSARGAVQLARDHPDRQVVFLAVGFETTAPATAVALLEAQREGLRNFGVLVCHKLVVPAMEALLADADHCIDGFLCPGHVSVIIGADAYRPIVRRHRRPCVIAGFESGGMARAIAALLRQVHDGRAALENLYPAVVSSRGNRAAQRLLAEVFEPADGPWRALGDIPRSTLALRPRFQRFDAMQRFALRLGRDDDHPACRCGEVIMGRVEPDACPLFANGCDPLRPVGPCMVSGEGTCAAWFKYGGRARPTQPAAHGATPERVGPGVRP
ncbi:MAG: hydrogenase formation protein HypD [Phycisphaerae bacterium]|nr:hydrogenase formation protein HypD [Phycisphaerae bacterium]MCZ2401292.1 hydrogenase formation protein HypD [Phycisphaerae bacterium]